LGRLLFFKSECKDKINISLCQNLFLSFFELRFLKLHPEKNRLALTLYTLWSLLQSGCKDNALFAAFPNLFFNYFVKKCQSAEHQIPDLRK